MSVETKDGAAKSSAERDAEKAVVKDAHERLAKEKGEFWARKVSFMVAMKVSLHALSNEQIKEQSLMLMGTDVLKDLRDHYGDEVDLKMFMADCQQLVDELLAGWDKHCGR